MILLALGTAVLMTAVAVAIGGLMLEAILFAISHSLIAKVELQVEQAGVPNVISLKTPENAMSSINWANEATA